MTQNVTQKTDVTPVQRRAVEALLTAPSIKAAAEVAGVQRKTLHRWLKDPAFTAALKEAESAAIASLSRRLAMLGEQAALALDDALQPGEDMKNRLRACEIVIGNLLKLKELIDFEQRLQDLEDAQQ